MRAWRFLLIILAFGLTTACVRDQLKQVRQFELAGNYAAAALEYKGLLAHVPDRDSVRRSELLVHIGDCLYRDGRMQEAYSSFQKAADANPANAVAHLRMGEMLLAAGAPDRARDHALLAASNSATSAEAMALLGATWLAEGNSSLAKQAYERALQFDPQRVSAAVALADIYNHENEEVHAEQTLRQAAAAQPTSPMPWLALGRLQEQEGDQRDAESSYRRAIALDDTPNANLRLAQFLQRSARIVEAEQVLRRIDSQQARHPVALADFELLSGRPADAVQQYRGTLRANQPPPEPKRWFLTTLRSTTNASLTHNSKDDAGIAARMIEAELLALSNVPGERRKQAIATVKANLQENASRFDAATLLILQAEAALTEDDIAQADTFARQAVELAPGSAPAHYIAGMVDIAKNDSEAAETEWQDALDQDSHFSPARLSIAEAALDRNDGPAADQQARLVVRDDPGDLQAILIFARALLLEGKPAAAAIMADRASSLSPSSPEPAAIMGQAALKLDNIPAALLNFERALLLSDDCEEAITGLLEVYRHGTLSYESIRHMEQVADEPPRSVALLEIAGRLYADRGWLSDAQRSLARAVALKPDRKTAARVLAELQNSGGNFAGASETAELSGIASQSLLKAYRSQLSGNWQNAAANYERALREGDQTGTAANNLAWLYAEHSQQLDRALTLAQSAADRSPNQPAILDTLGFVHLQRREYTDAVKYLENASRLASLGEESPDTRELRQQIRAHLSEAYLHTGQTQAAAMAQSARDVGTGALARSCGAKLRFFRRNANPYHALQSPRALPPARL